MDQDKSKVPVSGLAGGGVDCGGVAEWVVHGSGIDRSAGRDGMQTTTHGSGSDRTGLPGYVGRDGARGRGGTTTRTVRPRRPHARTHARGPRPAWFSVSGAPASRPPIIDGDGCSTERTILAPSIHLRSVEHRLIPFVIYNTIRCSDGSRGSSHMLISCASRPHLSAHVAISRQHRAHVAATS